MKILLSSFLIFSALTLMTHQAQPANMREIGCKTFADYGEYFGCLDCKEGYKQHDSFVTLYGICVNKSCSVGCTTCDSITKCTACAPFFYLVNGKCEKCSSECITCTDNTNCTYCIMEQFLSNKKCLSCAYGCGVCDNTKTCTSCSIGFYEDPAKKGYCKPCSKGCTICKDSNTCTVCLNGFTLKGNKCEGKDKSSNLVFYILLIVGNVLIVIFVVLFCYLVYWCARPNRRQRYSQMQNLNDPNNRH